MQTSQGTGTATIVGYHGYNNLGDDVFRNVLIEWLGRYLHVTRCFIAVKNPASAYRQGSVTVIPFANPVPAIARIHWVRVFLCAIRSESLVFGAGSIFAIQPFALLYLTVFLLRRLKGQHFAIVALGVSLGPFRNDREQSRCLRTLALMDRVLVRDARSLELLAASGGRVNYASSADLSLCADLPHVRPADAARKELVGLVVTERAFAGPSASTISGALAGLLDGLKQSNLEAPLQVRILCVCTDPDDGDVELSKQVARLLRTMNIKCDVLPYQHNELDQFIQAMPECSAIISSRLHGGIMGCLLGVPVCQIDYGCKAKDFYAQCGLAQDFLCSASDLQAGIIVHFLRQVRANDAREVASSVQKTLQRRGIELQDQLHRLAEQLLTGA